MKNTTLGIIALFLILPCLLMAGDTPLIGARFPALSPDGGQIAFGYLGDIWVVSAAGGRARRITDHEAYDHHPLWSPDGTQIAFTSNRLGNDDIFVVSAVGGTPTQLTWHSANDLATDWTPDGRSIVFTSGRVTMSSLYLVPVSGGTPRPMLAQYWTWPFAARVSPDGKTVAFSLGMENRYWWRTGYRGSNGAEIWIRPISGGEPMRLVDAAANSFSPWWTDNGAAVAFLSDSDGVYNVYKVSAQGGAPQAVTHFKEGHARWLSLSRDGKKATFEREFGIWVCDMATGQSQAVAIQAPSELKENAFTTVKDARVDEYAVSPDGKKVAAVVRGDIFILASDGGYARNLTKTPWRESGVIWTDDSRQVIYVADEDANPNLYRQDVLSGEAPVRLTQSKLDVLNPQLSPDGAWIAYACGPRQIRVIRPDGKDDKLLAEGDFGGRFGDGFSWAPDSRHVAFVESVRGQRDLFAVSLDDAKKIAMTNTAYDEGNPQWSPNGKFLLFSSNRSGHSFPEFTGQSDIYQLHLTPQKPEFDEDTFEGLFAEDKPQEKNGKKDAEPSAVTIRFQLDDLDVQTESVVRTLGEDRAFVLSPKDTQTVYFVTNIDGRSHFWKTSLDKKKRGRFDDWAKGVVNPRGLSLDKKGKYLYYLSGGKLGRVALASGKPEPIAFQTRIEVQKTEDYRQMLGEIYYVLEHYYYDEAHHDLNWKKAYDAFLPVLSQVREDADFYDYANMMIGLLNSSHTGVSGPRAARTEKPTAHVGARWAIGQDAITVGHLFKNGPLWLHRDSVAVGDKLVSVNGQTVQPSQNLWALFNGLLNKRVTLVFRSARLKREVCVAVKPFGARNEGMLLREEWVENCREQVRQATDDQVAYIHMPAMGYGDLVKFLKELERDAVPRKGLILDLRYNFGGNVHDRVLDALCRPSYGQWQVRGLSRTPQSTFGFSDKPVVLLTNEVTLSDGEMTSSGFKALKRGPIVGNTTYGWLIFTGGSRLLNGGNFRLPFWGCYTLEDVDLETHGGVTPDIPVINTLADDLAGRDPQLAKAIEVIQKEINK